MASRAVARDSGISASATQFYAQRDGPPGLLIAPAPETLDRSRAILLMIHDDPPSLDDQPLEVVVLPYLQHLGVPDTVQAFPIGSEAKLFVYSFSPR